MMPMGIDNADIGGGMMPATRMPPGPGADLLPAMLGLLTDAQRREMLATVGPMRTAQRILAVHRSVGPMRGVVAPGLTPTSPDRQLIPRPAGIPGLRDALARRGMMGGGVPGMGGM